MVQSIDVTWIKAIRGCALAGQIPYFEDDQVSTETWIGKAIYVKSWGKIIYKRFIRFNLYCREVPFDYLY